MTKVPPVEIRKIIILKKEHPLLMQPSGHVDHKASKREKKKDAAAEKRKYGGREIHGNVACKVSISTAPT